VEHETSIEKIADAVGAGFTRVDEDLEQMGENVDLVRANVDSTNVSMKSVLEPLEVLERQSTAKDKLVDDLNHHATILSKALGQVLVERISSRSCQAQVEGRIPLS